MRVINGNGMSSSVRERSNPCYIHKNCMHVICFIYLDDFFFSTVFLLTQIDV